jgi:hypothetical protein
LTKPEIEIATNIVNARWRSPYANYEHEVTGERDGHLDPRRVEALITGLPTSFDDPRQQVVYELASALVALRIVPLGLPLGDLSSAARAAVLSQLQFRPGNSPSFSHTSNHRCPLATLCRRPGKESDSSQDPSSGLTSVRPGVRKQWPGDCRCKEPHQCAQDQEPDRPGEESELVRRAQLEPDDGAQSVQIAGSQEYAPRSDRQHVAARPVGPAQAQEEEPIPIAVSQADEAG